MRSPFPRKRGSSAPLSNPQKAYLSQLAKEAHGYLTGNGAIDEPIKEWRRRESISACGRRISEAVNGDFELIEAHFKALRGRTSQALDSAMRADTNEERQARYKLAQLCQERGLEVPELPEASVKKIWAVYFNIKQQPKRKAAAESLASLTSQMKQAVQQERYEDAAALKRQIEAALRTPAAPAEPDTDDIPY